MEATACQLIDMTDIEEKEPAERRQSPAGQKTKYNSTYPYYIENDRLWKVAEKEDEKSLDVSRAVEIDSITQDADTLEVKIKLKYFYNGQYHKIEVPRKILTKNKIVELLDVGVDVADHKVKHVLQFLNKQEETIPLTFTHKHLGFCEPDGQLIYKHYHAIGGNSVYNGDFVIKPTGDEVVWNQLIKNHVLGHTPLELALTLGFAAPVASIIGKIIGMEVMLVHLYGDSTQGKTTAIQLAVSSFGSPQLKEKGLVRNWNSTKNALIGLLRDVHGVPMAFDEASVQDITFTDIIYIIAMGQEKERLNKNSDLKKLAQWSGLFLSTAEHALSLKSNQNTGLQLRLLELGNIKWTSTAEQADALKTGLTQNYGHTGPKFVEYLLEKGSDYILQCWQDCKNSFTQKLSNPDRFVSRIADKMATILATAKMVKEALELDLDVDGIEQLLLENVTESNGTRDLGEKAYKYLLEMVTRHNNKFSISDSTEPFQEVWGKIVFQEGVWKEIYIPTKKFEEIMTGGGFEDVNVILRIWRDRGLLDCEVNKLTRKKRLIKGSAEIPVRVIKVSEDMTGTIEEEKRVRKVTKQDAANLEKLFGEE